jgi:hypothetical protein
MGGDCTHVKPWLLFQSSTFSGAIANVRPLAHSARTRLCCTGARCLYWRSVHRLHRNAPGSVSATPACAQAVTAPRQFTPAQRRNSPKITDCDDR